MAPAHCRGTKSQPRGEDRTHRRAAQDHPRRRKHRGGVREVQRGAREVGGHRRRSRRPLQGGPRRIPPSPRRVFLQHQHLQAASRARLAEKLGVEARVDRASENARHHRGPQGARDAGARPAKAVVRRGAFAAGDLPRVGGHVLWSDARNLRRGEVLLRRHPRPV